MSFPTVSVAMMQRDEGPILARWLDHYSALFGAESLVIYDNCSKDPFTLQLLAGAEIRGATVIRDQRDYRIKHELMLDLFRARDAGPHRTDFYLPVDCDEYLVALTRQAISFDREMILAELMRHRHSDLCLQIPGSFYNDPGMDGAYVLDWRFNKSFFRSGAIGTLDTGFHFGTSGITDEVKPTRLGYLHHHNKALAAAKETARAKLRAAEAVDPHGAGAGYLRWLIGCSEHEYATRYDKRLRVILGPYMQFPVLLRPGLAPDAWNGAAYLRAHPDVAARYELGALHHYMAHGYDENRVLVPSGAPETAEGAE